MTEGIMCTCTDWQTHRMSLAPLLAEAPFRYCPWCGQRLAAGGQRDDAGWMGWGYGDYVTEQVSKIMHHFSDV